MLYYRKEGLKLKAYTTYDHDFDPYLGDYLIDNMPVSTEQVVNKTH